MALESWNEEARDNRSAKMIRSISQDSGRAFKSDFLRRIYPKKMVDGKDIGAICTDWVYLILTNLKYDQESLEEKLMMLYDDYDSGINPDTDPDFLEYMAVCGIMPFAELVDELPVLSKISFGGRLEKPEARGKGMDEVEW
jgi:hypothetical protein